MKYILIYIMLYFSVVSAEELHKYENSTQSAVTHIGPQLNPDQTSNTISTGVQLSVKVFLEGPFNGSGMNTGLASIIDTLYRSTGSGLITMNPLYAPPSGAVDVIKVYLRDASAPSNVRDSANAWLISDGTIRDFDTGLLTNLLFSNVSTGSYYVEVRHRNHLPVMTATTYSLSNVAISIDLTNINNIYNKKAKVISTSLCALYAADLVYDGKKVINASDLFRIATKIAGGSLTNQYSIFDVNLDSYINIDDYNLVSDHNNKLYFSSVP